MTTYRYSTTTSGVGIPFDPATDVFIFDDSISAIHITGVEQQADGLLLTVTNSGTKYIYLAGTTLTQLTSTNLTFQTGAEFVPGSNVSDMLISAATGSWLWGRSGDDMLLGLTSGRADGGVGHDTISGTGRLYGDDGNDSLTTGGSAATTLSGGAGDDTLTLVGTLSASVGLDGGDGTDVFRGTADMILLDAGSHVWIMQGGVTRGSVRNVERYELGGQAVTPGVYLTGSHNRRDTLIGTDQRDHLIGSGFDSYGASNSGADVLYGGGGGDTLSGGSDPSATPTTYYAGDIGYGGAGDDWIAAATAYGGDGDDMIYAGTAYGGAGSDTVGVGNSPLSYAYSSLEGAISWGGLIRADVEFVRHTTQGLVNLYTGISSTATIGGVAGLFGNDTLTAGTSQALTFSGNIGDDQIQGGAGADTIYGGADNDLLRGGGGADLVYGGTGDDTIYGDDGDDRLYGQGGNDAIYGGDGRDVMGAGGPGGGIDSLYGGAGDDIASLGGRLSEYTASVIEGGIRLTHTSGSTVDLFNVELISDSISGRSLVASTGDDMLFGTTVGDALLGLAGNDTLTGFDGNDTLRGGSGNDVLWGGGGTDVAVFSDNAHQYDVRINTDGSMSVRHFVSGGDGEDRLYDVEMLRFADGDRHALMLSVDNVVQAEGDGDGTVVFTVRLNRAFDEAVSVSYQTIAGTATAEWDYLSAWSGLNFAPGETEKTVSIQIVGDRQVEGDETFRLSLFQAHPASGGPIYVGEGRATLLNDDVNVLPTASGVDITLDAGESVAASSLFNVTDANGDAIARYQFRDASTGGGAFYLNGSQQNAGTSIEVTAANLANLTYRAGSAGQSDLLWVRGNDGTGWGEWESLTATATNPSESTASVLLSRPQRVRPCRAGWSSPSAWTGPLPPPSPSISLRSTVRRRRGATMSRTPAR